MSPVYDLTNCSQIFLPVPPASTVARVGMAAGSVLPAAGHSLTEGMSALLALIRMASMSLQRFIRILSLGSSMGSGLLATISGTLNTLMETPLR